MSAPIAATAVWQAVMERAGYRCQCTSCPRHRRQEGGQCETEASGHTKLTAGPVNPGVDPTRTITAADPATLVAWCADCWDCTVASARKHARVTTQCSLASADTLF